MTDQTTSNVEQRRIVRSALRIGIVLGVGSMGALDEIIFHQLLQWHHFYDHSTDSWRIFSDGLFHVFTSSMLLQIRPVREGVPNILPYDLGWNGSARLLLVGWLVWRGVRPTAVAS